MDLFDFYQHGQIRQAADAADDARSEAQRVAQDLRKLEQRFDRLNLVTQALWEIVREATQITDERLVRKMQEIDLRDGTADGRMTPMPVECPACRRRSNSRRDQCIYCGAKLPGRNLLERLQ